MELFLTIALLQGYSQDPRSCSDPRTQYPSNPPCFRIMLKDQDYSWSNKVKDMDYLLKKENTKYS